MAYWLMKSEPDTFSIENLRRLGHSGWDGVRNYQARNFIKAMRNGDKAFFYHSSTQPPCIAGEAEIIREAYPDPSQFNSKSPYYDAGATPEAPRWYQVDVKFVKAFAAPLSLETIRGMPELQGMALLKRSRLSVQPVTAAEWNFLQKRLR